MHQKEQLYEKMDNQIIPFYYTLPNNSHWAICSYQYHIYIYHPTTTLILKSKQTIIKLVETTLHWCCVVDWILITSHDRTSIRVLITECMEMKRIFTVLGDSGRGWGILYHSNVPGRGFLVISLSRVGLRHQIVGHVRPYLRLLPRRFGLLQHLVRVHVACHSHLLLLPVNLHWLHP